MKNVFAHHLFWKLGLFISTCTLSQLNIESLYAREIASPLAYGNAVSELWAQNEPSSFDIQVQPGPRRNKGPNPFERDAPSQNSQGSRQNPNVFFSVDTPSTGPYEQINAPTTPPTTGQNLSAPPMPSQSLFSLDSNLNNAYLTSDNPFQNPFDTAPPQAAEPQFPGTPTPSAPAIVPVEPSVPAVQITAPASETPSAIPVPGAPAQPVTAPPLASPPLAPIEPGLPRTEADAVPIVKPIPPKSILINFNNVSIIEYIRFIARISGKNFIFDEADLQFNVTIVSEEPTSIENIMTALLQELRIHDLTLIEQGNNLIIHRSNKVNSISKVVAEDINATAGSSEIVTQVFKLNTLDPERAASLIRPLVSERALISTLNDPNHLVITDLVSNVNEIAKLIKSLDSPISGMVIGQFVSRIADAESLVPLVQRIMQPIALDQPLIFVPYESSNSIFIVSTPFLVERSISILQHLDQEQGKTRIIDLDKLKLEEEKTLPSVPSGPRQPGGPGAPGGPGDRGGRAETEAEREARRTGRRGFDGAIEGIVPYFIPVETGTSITAEEQALIDLARQSLPPPPNRVGITQFPPRVLPIPSETIPFQVDLNPDFIARPVKPCKFYIYRLKYRRGDLLLAAVQQVAASLQLCSGHEDFLATISSVQWLQDTKALVFSGTPETLDKIRDLLEELDIPLRQVFIEMLILETTVDDSLLYSVNWGTRFGGGGTAGSQGFQTGASPLQGALDSTGVTGLGGIRPLPGTTANPFNNSLIPDPTNLARSEGFNLGIIGEHIIHKGLGLRFNSMGALVKALHTRSTDKIIMSPKIMTEDGIPAQIFVGINTPYKTQSIANDRGSTISNNFEYRDVGTSLQVTPFLNNSDIVTLEIIQESSQESGQGQQNQNVRNLSGPTTKKNTTRTTVLIPDGFFCVLSGMIQEEDISIRTQVPCLGSIPLLGGAFSDLANTDNKRNLMLFIRPKIIDTDEEIQNMTRHMQDVWFYQNEIPKMWLQETEDALDFFNVRQTLKTDDLDNDECPQFAH